MGGDIWEEGKERRVSGEMRELSREKKSFVWFGGGELPILYRTHDHLTDFSEDPSPDLCSFARGVFGLSIAKISRPLRGEQRGEGECLRKLNICNAGTVLELDEF